MNTGTIRPKRTTRIARIAAALALGASTLFSVAAAPAPADSYVVVLRDGVPAQQVANEHAGQHGFSPIFVYEHALKGYAATIPASRLAQIKADPRVAYVTADRSVSLVQSATGKPSSSAKPGSGNTGSTEPTDDEVPSGISRIGAPSASNKGNGIGVAVIDTGIDLRHEDLSGVVNLKTCIVGTRNANDDNGHGSHVAGTIGARDNGKGVVGVAPEATLYAVKVLDRNGSGSWSSVICGIDAVTANAGKISVANMSLGGAGSSTLSREDCTNVANDAMHEAICKSTKKGVTYVVAAGNDAADASGSTPAAYEEVITVSAWSDSNGNATGGAAPTCRAGEADEAWATFTNYGSVVDIAAPGVCIKSTWKSGAYNTISGTSMAAPHVAGAAALYVAKNPGASPAAVRTALTDTTEPLTNKHNDSRHPENLLNASKF